MQCLRFVKEKIRRLIYSTWENYSSELSFFSKSSSSSFHAVSPPKHECSEGIFVIHFISFLLCVLIDFICLVKNYDVCRNLSKF